jgi:FHA domain
MVAEKNDSDDTKSAGMSPPPQPKDPARHPPAGQQEEHEARDPTQFAAASAPKPQTPLPSPPPQPVAPSEPEAGRPDAPPALPASRDVSSAGALDDETRILPQQSVVTARLLRIQPPGRKDLILLDRSSYTIGRSHTCDIRLYSPSAHREHARLFRREGGWWVVPLESKAVVVNDENINAEVALAHEMRLEFGGDELLFLDESLAPPRAEAGVSPPAAIRLIRAAGLVVLVAALAAVAAWWLLLK